jgi:hypothetical protein
MRAILVRSCQWSVTAWGLDATEGFPFFFLFFIFGRASE